MANLSIVADRLGKVMYEWSSTRGLLRYRPSLTQKAEGKRGRATPWLCSAKSSISMSTPSSS